MFVETGFSIVAACRYCWTAIPVITSIRRLLELFASEFDSLGFDQPLVNCCPVILVLTGSDVGVIVG